MTRAHSELQATPHAPSRCRSSVVYEPMTDLEAEAIACLADCSFPVASWPKRFARTIAARLRMHPRSISPGQRAALWRTVHKFRRQIELVRVREYAAGFVAQFGKSSAAVKPLPERDDRRSFKTEDWCLFGPPAQHPIHHAGTAAPPPTANLQLVTGFNPGADA